MKDSKADDYGKVWVGSAQKCRPTEEWHWPIMERDYLAEFEWIKLAVLGRCAGTEPASSRGDTWQGIEKNARLIAEAIARRFREHDRPLPYVNTLWLVSGRDRGPARS